MATSCCHFIRKINGETKRQSCKKRKASDKEYKSHDGDGLFLRVRPSGAKSWLFSYRMPYDGLSFEERLQFLLDQESLSRDTRKHARLIKQARFKLNATIHGIDYKQYINITKNQIAQLAQTDWIVRKQNLLLTGPCGSGKTYLACGLGHSACLKGLQTRY